MLEEGRRGGDNKTEEGEITIQDEEGMMLMNGGKTMERKKRKGDVRGL